MIKWLVEEFKLPVPPFWMIAGLLILSCMLLLPPAIIALARETDSTKPRLHPVQDMGSQAKYKAQTSSPVFADGRSMRDPVAGTVGWGADPKHPDDDALAADDHYYRGYKIENGETVYYEGFPDRVVVDDALLKRGRERYGIYCFPCHGAEGFGNGPVHQRALTLKGGTVWVPPSNLTDAERKSRTDGFLFNVITNGIRNMPSYGAQVPVKDRWAIVSYVRALQLRQQAP